MRKLRTDDFDPHAVPELSSPLDDLPAIERPVVPSIPVQEKFEPHRQIANPSPAESTPVLPPDRAPARTPVRRVNTRYAFEFYQDQIERLRAFSLEEKMRGDKGSMSEMVREAVDMYIAKRERSQAK